MSAAYLEGKRAGLAGDPAPAMPDRNSSREVDERYAGWMDGQVEKMIAEEAKTPAHN